MIVVTGVSGLFGASVVTLARDLGREVVGICHHNLFRAPGTRTCGMDLINRQAVRTLLDALQPKGVIHCAAATSVDWCELEQDGGHPYAVRLRLRFVWKRRLHLRSSRTSRAGECSGLIVSR